VDESNHWPLPEEWAPYRHLLSDADVEFFLSGEDVKYFDNLLKHFQSNGLNVTLGRVLKPPMKFMLSAKPIPPHLIKTEELGKKSKEKKASEAMVQIWKDLDKDLKNPSTRKLVRERATSKKDVLRPVINKLDEEYTQQERFGILPLLGQHQLARHILIVFKRFFSKEEFYSKEWMEIWSTVIGQLTISQVIDGAALLLNTANEDKTQFDEMQRIAGNAEDFRRFCLGFMPVRPIKPVVKKRKLRDIPWTEPKARKKKKKRLGPYVEQGTLLNEQVNDNGDKPPDKN